MHACKVQSNLPLSVSALEISCSWVLFMICSLVVWQPLPVVVNIWSGWTGRRMYGWTDERTEAMCITCGTLMTLYQSHSWLLSYWLSGKYFTWKALVIILTEPITWYLAHACMWVKMMISLWWGSLIWLTNFFQCVFRWPYIVLFYPLYYSLLIYTCATGGLLFVVWQCA